MFIADFRFPEIIHVSWIIDSRRKPKYCCGTFGPERGGNRFIEFQREGCCNVSYFSVAYLSCVFTGYDRYSYSKTRGLFGGVSIEGSVIVERQDANALAYNQNVSAKALLSGTVPCPDWAEPLVKTLESRTSKPGVQNWIDDRAEGQAPYAFSTASATSTTGSKPQRFSPFLGKKKKDAEFPPRHWGARADSGSYFADDVDDRSRTRWEDIGGASPRPSGFDDEFESSLSAAQQANHRSSRSVGAPASTSHVPVDSYDPASPFNSLPPFHSVHSTLSDKPVSHSRSMSTPKMGYSAERDSLPGYTNPFASTPPPEDELEYYHDNLGSSPPPFKIKPELSKPLSPREGVARAIALYEFKAVEVRDLIVSKELSTHSTVGR